MKIMESLSIYMLASRDEGVVKQDEEPDSAIQLQVGMAQT